MGMPGIIGLAISPTKISKFQCAGSNKTNPQHTEVGPYLNLSYMREGMDEWSTTDLANRTQQYTDAAKLAIE